jgi:hypothetical protein
MGRERPAARESCRFPGRGSWRPRRLPGAQTARSGRSRRSEMRSPLQPDLPFGGQLLRPSLRLTEGRPSIPVGTAPLRLVLSPKIPVCRETDSGDTHGTDPDARAPLHSPSSSEYARSIHYMLTLFRLHTQMTRLPSSTTAASSRRSCAQEPAASESPHSMTMERCGACRRVLRRIVGLFSGSCARLCRRESFSPSFIAAE